jgi:hypothetical protein
MPCGVLTPQSSTRSDASGRRALSVNGGLHILQPSVSGTLQFPIIQPRGAHPFGESMCFRVELRVLDASLASRSHNVRDCPELFDPPRGSFLAKGVYLFADLAVRVFRVTWPGSIPRWEYLTDVRLSRKDNDASS